MTNANNDVRELEDLLTELEGQGALPVGNYSDEDDAVTQLMDAPLGEEEWMVQVTPLDRRMMSTEQLLAEIASATLVKRDTLVWRTGMSDWAPVSRIDALANAAAAAVPSERRPLPPLPLPPPTPVPPSRFGTSTMVSHGVLPINGAPSAGQTSNGQAPNGLAANGLAANGLAANAASSQASNGAVTLGGLPSATRPLPPVPSTPYGAPKSLTPVPDAPPPAPLPLLNSAFGSPGALPPPPVPPPVASSPRLPEFNAGFNIPPPAPAPNPPAPTTMRTNTPRPVAVDFSEMEPERRTPTRVLVGSGVAAVLMIIGTVYALSAGGVFESNADIAHEPAHTESAESAAAVAPAPVAAKSPEAKSSEPKAAEPKPAAAPVKESASDSKSEPQTQPVSTKEELVAAPQLPAKAEKPAAQAERGSDESATEQPMTRAERRAAARRKRAAAPEEEPTAAPRRKPKAPVAAPATATAAVAAEADEAPKGGDQPGSTFNKQAAKTALDDAATQAKNCRPQGGPSGSGKVQVRYEPTGKVGAVSIMTPQFDNTTTGDCVVMVFRRANIPAFTGSPPVIMNKTFDIP